MAAWLLVLPHIVQSFAPWVAMAWPSKVQLSQSQLVVGWKRVLHPMKNKGTSRRWLFPVPARPTDQKGSDPKFPLPALRRLLGSLAHFTQSVNCSPPAALQETAEHQCFHHQCFHCRTNNTTRGRYEDLNTLRSGVYNYHIEANIPAHTRQPALATTPHPRRLTHAPRSCGGMPCSVPCCCRGCRRC